MTLHSGGSSGEYSFHQSLTREQGEEKNAVQGWYLSCKTCKTSKLIFSQLKQNYCQTFYDYLQLLFKGTGPCERLWSKMEQD